MLHPYGCADTYTTRLISGSDGPLQPYGQNGLCIDQHLYKMFTAETPVHRCRKHVHHDWDVYILFTVVENMTQLRRIYPFHICGKKCTFTSRVRLIIIPCSQLWKTYTFASQLRLILYPVHSCGKHTILHQDCLNGATRFIGACHQTYWIFRVDVITSRHTRKKKSHLLHVLNKGSPNIQAKCVDFIAASRWLV